MTVYTSLVSNVLFPLHERLKRHDTVRILRDLDRTQWLPAEQLRELQSTRLEALLRHVRTSSPYFASRVGDALHAIARDAPLEEVLAALPTTDKRLIRSEGKRWVDHGAHGLISQQTSGSSGEPLHFKLSAQRVSFDIAAKWRATRWWDVDIGDRELVLWNSPLELGSQDVLRGIRDRIFRSRLVSTHALGPRELDTILDGMLAFRPRMLFGYPSALSRLARRALERGLDLSSADIRVAFCTSEVLRPEWRSQISEAFRCSVANEYGARDAGFIARECPEGRMHVTAEELIVEVVGADAKAVEPGSEGEIVVTNLASESFPFVRYRTGDRGKLSDERCPCGRGLPVLEEILGRSNDGLVGPDGIWVHGSAVNHVMREISGLQAYRVTQHEIRDLEIQLVLEAALDPATESRLRTHLQHLLGDSVQVHVRRVEDIPPLANGKFRHIVSKIPHDPVRLAT